MFNKKIIYALFLLINCGAQAMEEHPNETIPSLHNLSLDNLSLAAVTSDITLTNLSLVALAQNIVEKCNKSEEFLNRYAHDPGPWSYQKEDKDYYLPKRNINYLAIELEKTLWHLVPFLLHSNNNLSHAAEKAFDSQSPTLTSHKKAFRRLLFPFYRNQIMNKTTHTTEEVTLHQRFKVDNKTREILDKKRYNAPSCRKVGDNREVEKWQLKTENAVANFNEKPCEQNRRILYFYLNMGGWNRKKFFKIRRTLLFTCKQDLELVKNCLNMHQLASILHNNTFTQEEIKIIVNDVMKPHMNCKDLLTGCIANFFILPEPQRSWGIAALGELKFDQSVKEEEWSNEWWPLITYIKLWPTSTPQVFNKIISKISDPKKKSRLVYKASYVINIINCMDNNSLYQAHPHMIQLKELIDNDSSSDDTCFKKDDTHINFFTPMFGDAPDSCLKSFPNKNFNFLSEFILYLSDFTNNAKAIKNFLYHNKKMLHSLDWDMLYHIKKRAINQNNQPINKFWKKVQDMIDEENQRRTKQSIATSLSIKKYRPGASLFIEKS